MYPAAIALTLAIASAPGHLVFESIGVDADEFEKPLIQRAVVKELAIFSQKRGAAFIEQARQQGVSAKPAARAARRVLREIGREEGHVRLL